MKVVVKRGLIISVLLLLGSFIVSNFIFKNRLITGFKEVSAAGLSIGNVSDNRNEYFEGNIPKYDKIEITFKVESSVAKNYYFPYDATPPQGIEAKSGITVEALFSKDNWATSYVQPAFYYQEFIDEVKGSKEWFYPTNNYLWKARFSPNNVGTWQYKLKVQDAGGIYETQPSSFVVSESANKGFVKVSKNDSRYFEYENGTYFPGMGYNMNFSGVSWDNPVIDNQKNFEVMGQNGIQLIRVWLSQWSIYGSEWNPWMPIKPQLYNAYSPVTGMSFEEVFPGSEVSMKIDVNKNACMFMPPWKADVAVKRNTNYRVRVRYKLTELGTPSVSGKPYGLVAKTGGWLWRESDSTQNCNYTGTGLVVTDYQTSVTSGWQELTGVLNSEDKHFLPYFYIALENTTSGVAYIDYVWVEEILGNGQYGQNIIYKPWMAHHQYIDQRHAYAFDKALSLAQKNNIYFRLVVMEKKDRILANFDFNGQPALSMQEQYFYGNHRNMTKTRWLQQAWWRYLQARWGYSTNVHSWELLNEGNPTLGEHYTLADEFGKYMHKFTPNSHLVTTSTWHSYPQGRFWSDTTKYPNVDYSTFHRYIDEASATDMKVDGWDQVSSKYNLTSVSVANLDDFYDSAAQVEKMSLMLGAKEQYGSKKPTIRGETGFEQNGNAHPDLTKDLTGTWLHNFIWAGINSGGVIESYWYANKHIWDDARGTFDFRPEFGNYYRFIKDVPLSNGNYVNAEAIASNNTLRVMGQKDIVNNRAHLWIQNKNYTWKNVLNKINIQFQSGEVAIAGFGAEKILRVEWWDTHTGLITSTQNYKTDSSGKLLLKVDNLSKDIAVKMGDYALASTPTSTPTLTATPSPITNVDANVDGKIDESDYLIWKSNYNTSQFGVSNGEFNGDGTVDGADYVLWLNEYGG